MKHIKLFEDFNHTPQEYDQMEDRYISILTDKAVNIKVKYRGEEIELMPNIKLWTGYKGLNEEFSYILNFNENAQTINGRGRKSPIISVKIYNNGKIVDVWRASHISVESSEIHKILRMIGDASDYIGGVDMDDVERKLNDELKNNTEPSPWNI